MTDERTAMVWNGLKFVYYFGKTLFFTVSAKKGKGKGVLQILE